MNNSQVALVHTIFNSIVCYLKIYCYCCYVVCKNFILTLDSLFIITLKKKLFCFTFTNFKFLLVSNTSGVDDDFLLYLFLSHARKYNNRFCSQAVFEGLMLRLRGAALKQVRLSTVFNCLSKTLSLFPGLSGFITHLPTWKFKNN